MPKPLLTAREIFALRNILAKTAKQTTPRHEFILAAKDYLEKTGWLTIDRLNKEHSKTVTQAFSRLTDAMYTSQDQLVRAMTREEVAGIILTTGRVGIDKKKPQISGLQDTLDPAQHLIHNNSLNMFATAHSRQDESGEVNTHAMLYAAEYTKLHGLKGSFMLFLGRPLVSITQSKASVLYPVPYDRVDKEQQNQVAPEDFTKLPASCIDDAQKPEVTVVTGVPGTNIDWRPTLQDVLGFLSVNTLQKLARFFKNQCPTRENQAAFINEAFAPYTFSIDVVGSVAREPTLRDVATENAHKHGILTPDVRPLVVEDIFDAVPTLLEMYPRLPARWPLALPARVEELSSVPIHVTKPGDVKEFLVEQHRPFYQAEKAALEKAKSLHLDVDSHHNPFL